MNMLYEKLGMVLSLKEGKDLKEKKEMPNVEAFQNKEENK
jgi:hypothetical protein